MFAGCLHADGTGASKLKQGASTRLHVLQMDVTNDAEVESCVKYVSYSLDGSGMLIFCLMLVMKLDTTPLQRKAASAISIGGLY